MTARHWMQIAALTSALGLSGAAMAHGTDRMTGSDERDNVSSYGMDTPSSGAIVTPEDKASGLGKDNGHARNRNGGVNDDTSLNDNASNDEALSVNPGRSNDEGRNLNPGPSTDEDLSVNPDRADRVDRGDASRLDEDESAPPRTGSDVQPGVMGPGSLDGRDVR